MMSSHTVVAENLSRASHNHEVSGREHPEGLAQGLRFSDRLPIWVGRSKHERERHRLPAIGVDSVRQESLSDGDRIAKATFFGCQNPMSDELLGRDTSRNSVAHSVGLEQPDPSSEPDGTKNPSIKDSPTVHSTSSIDQNSQLSRSFINPKKVPGTNQNIYPLAPIAQECQQRYRQLVDLFKQAVDTHKYLRHHTSSINYELRLCGSTPADATASVVVFCAVAVFKQLRTLLTSRHIRRQYELENRSLSNKFPFTSKDLPVPIPSMVPLRVVFWRESALPTQRKSTMEQVVTESHSMFTLCGSLVRYGDRTSTLGLLISMDSKIYGLTVDHLFTEASSDRVRSVGGPETVYHANDYEADVEEVFQEDATDIADEQEMWFDHVNYDDLEEDLETLVEAGGVSEIDYEKVEVETGANEPGSDAIKGHREDCVTSLHPSTPYLDWALINFDAGNFERPNMVISQNDSSCDEFLSRIAPLPPKGAVSVFMISGVSGKQRGTMLSTSSYIGGNPGESLCQTWNVVLSGSASKFLFQREYSVFQTSNFDQNN
jgi:hypothetical protein